MTRIVASPPMSQYTSSDGQPQLTQVGTNLFQNKPKPGKEHVLIDRGDFAKKKNFQGCSPASRMQQLNIKADMLKILSRHPPDSLFGKFRIAREEEYKTMLSWHEEALAKPVRPQSPEQPYGITQVGTNRFQHHRANGTRRMIDFGNFAKEK
jgi:hypothetical protein